MTLRVTLCPYNVQDMENVNTCEHFSELMTENAYP